MRATSRAVSSARVSVSLLCEGWAGGMGEESEGAMVLGARKDERGEKRAVGIWSHVVNLALTARWVCLAG